MTAAAPFSFSRIPKYNPGRPEHLWVVLGAWRVDPASPIEALATAGLVRLVGPGCYHCEKPWAAEREPTACPGRPSTSPIGEHPRAGERS